MFGRLWGAYDDMTANAAGADSLHAMEMARSRISRSMRRGGVW